MRASTCYVPTGTRSFRLAARQWFVEYGVQLQNPGKEIITIYCAPPGRVIVQADQAGAEALVVAYEALPGTYRELFINGIKPHTFLALHIFHAQRADWFAGIEPVAFWLTKSPAELRASSNWPVLDKRIKYSDMEYAIGKRTAHAKSYRMGWKTYQLSNLKHSGGTLVLNREQCIAFLGMFERLFPEIIEWQSEVEFLVKSRRILYNKFGFPRAFERILTDSYIREAISFIPQSTVGCLTHQAFINVQNHIERCNRPWDLVSNKHDSLAVECPESDAAECGRILLAELCQEFTGRDGVKYRMGAEAAVGRNWGKRSADNPLGMEGMKL